MNKQLPLPEDSTPRARNAFLTAALIAVAHFAAVLYYLYLGRSTSAAQLYALAAISFAIGLVISVGAALSRRGQTTPGMILTLVVLSVSYPPIATLLAGLGSVLGLALMVVGPMIAFQFLRGRSSRVMTIFTIAAGLATVLLDRFSSPARPSLPGMFIPLLAVSVVGVLGFFIVRQFRDYPLRTKLTGSFILFSLVMGAISVVLVQRAIQPIIDDTLPTVTEAGRLHQLLIEIQNESALFVANGDTTHLEHLNRQAAELETLAEQFAGDLADDSQEVETFTRTAQIAQEISETAQSVARSHTTTLEYQRTLDGYEAEAQAVFKESQGLINAEIARNIQAGDLEELNTDSLPSLKLIGEFIVEVQNLQIESNQYVTLSDAETLEEFEAAETQLEEVQKKLAQILEASEPGEGDLIAKLDETEEKIETTARQIIGSRDQTLAYIAQLEILTGEFDLVSVQVDQVIDEEISSTTTGALTNSSLMSLAVSILAALLGYGLASMIARPVAQLVTAANQITDGDLTIRARVNSRDELGTLASAFNTMTSQLQENIGSLEQRVADRTRNLELAAEVGRSVSQVRALDVMLKDAAELLRSRFELYYVQVYLTNLAGNTLLLKSGTGTAGMELVSHGHQLPIDSGSINGRAVVEKHSVVIPDTAASVSFRPNPLLPETRSEMAIPLIVGENVVGVLDLQSRKAGSLNEAMLPAFEALAGQLAIAVQNASLLAETEQARAEVEAQSRRLVRKEWNEYQDAIHQPEHTGFAFERNQFVALGEEELSALPVDANALEAPIAIGGEPLGRLVVEMDEQSRNAQNTELVNMVARQVAQQIENLRLLESAERYRAEAEQAARRVSIEGWQRYMESRSGESLGYIYNLNEVRPVSEQQPLDESVMLPVKAGEATVGKLAIQGLPPDDSEAIELANAVAERLGAHLENLRLLEDTRRGQLELDKRARQLAAVAEISTLSAKELDVVRMLETVAHLTQRKFGLYHAHIFVYDQNKAELKIAACGWTEGNEHEGTHESTALPLAQEQSLVARAARTKESVIVNDVGNEPGWLPNPLLPNTRAEMAVPLLLGDQVIGVLDVQSDRLDAFSEEDANIQTTLAAQVATAMQNARSVARARQQAERESMLNTISQKIQSATTVEAVLQIAARELGHALGAPLTIAQLGVKVNGNGSN